MKSVLVSIQPKWCELIASGKKTLEVRKTRPKLDTPFKVYIYETKSRKKQFKYRDLSALDDDYRIGFDYEGRGQAIGEFVCDSIMPYCRYEIISGASEAGFEELSRATQLSRKELYDYCGEKDIYCWHISDLVIYDKPNDLREFHKVGYTETKESVSWLTRDEENSWQIKRPPQSWCYVDHPTEKGGAE